jgi:hypothetical protein
MQGDIFGVFFQRILVKNNKKRKTNNKCIIVESIYIYVIELLLLYGTLESICINP